jgi:hypothetical protein
MQVVIDWSLEVSEEDNHQCEWFRNFTEFSRAFAIAKNEGMLHEETDERTSAMIVLYCRKGLYRGSRRRVHQSSSGFPYRCWNPRISHWPL